MRKYTSTDESAKVLTPQQTKVVENELSRLGKVSARDLSDDERANVQSALDKSDSH